MTACRSIEKSADQKLRQKSQTRDGVSLDSCGWIFGQNIPSERRGPIKRFSEEKKTNALEGLGFVKAKKSKVGPAFAVVYSAPSPGDELSK